MQLHMWMLQRKADDTEHYDHQLLDNLFRPCELPALLARLRRHQGLLQITRRNRGGGSYDALFSAGCRRVAPARRRRPS